MAKVSIKGRDAEAANTIEAAPPPRIANAITKTDDLGRQITIKRPNAVQRMRIIDAIGGQSASNQAYLGQVMLAVAVVRIDEDDVPFPRTKREIEALVERLGDEGLNAAGGAIAELMGIEIDEDGNVVARDEKARSKN